MKCSYAYLAAAALLASAAPAFVAPPSLEPMVVYVAIENRREGPFDRVELAKMVADRRLTAATLVWQHGMVGWEPAAGVANLKPLLAGPPPLPGGGPPPLPGA